MLPGHLGEFEQPRRSRGSAERRNGRFAAGRPVDEMGPALGVFVPAPP